VLNFHEAVSNNCAVELYGFEYDDVQNASLHYKLQVLIDRGYDIDFVADAVFYCSAYVTLEHYDDLEIRIEEGG
jgi:hypothetical protein